MPKAKITVVRIAAYADLIEEHVDVERYPGNAGPCPFWKLGQEFLLEGDWPEKPKGFCESAWSDIHTHVAMIMLGGNLPWLKSRGVDIVCCNDGFRPVSFKIERLES
ncbi:TIGR04076 family protein [Candidatus Bipolaricaulota bacterium]